jgi:thiol-disulfide isomerase/thioredoxin
MSSIESNDKDKIMAEFEAHTAKGDMFMIMFTGGAKADGNSWCGDCVVAKPMMAKVKEALAGKMDVITAVLQERDDWCGVSDHIFRKNALLQVSGIPTMILFQGKQRMSKISEPEEWQNAELLAMFEAAC